MLKQYRQMLLALIKNKQIMAVKYMKKVRIHVIYVERCRVIIDNQFLYLKFS